MLIRILLFFILNFAALGIGVLFTGKGVSSQWYADLSKAPWTPPGWVFGAAWTTIMIAFAVYAAYAWGKIANKKLFAGLFILQWILNVAWNPVFFYYHDPLIGLIIITTLLLLMGYFLFGYMPQLKIYSLLVLPYFVWLIIATSLNGYILFNN
jgi:translocator protein